MSNSSPKDIADDVYWALESSSELPSLPCTYETRRALLDFHVEPQVQGQVTESQQEDQYQNETQKPSQSNNDDISRPQEEQYMEEGQGQSKGKKGQGRVFGAKGEQVVRPSLLMLEALSRRRLDAVIQLHSVCPLLLSSIPLFERGSCTDTRLHPENSCQLNVEKSRTDATDTSSANVPLEELPPIRRQSRLLDTAAENKDLLVFVLQNHPEMERTESLEDLTNARQEFDRKVSEDIYSHEQNKKAFETLEEGFLHKRKETHKKTSGEDKDHGTGDEDEAQQMDILCSSLDPNNPITICLQKRNVAVLQYLLYKHVWQHFLLDDVFALPQTSQVPDLDPTRPRSPRPEVDWFLHCCSLMGCPQLLEKVLSGSFGTEIPRSHENAKRNTRKDIPATSKSDLEPGTSCGAVGQSQVGECIELREEYACTKEVTSGGSESHPTEFPVLPNTIAGVSEVSTDLPDDASPTGNDMPSRPHSAGSVRLKGDQRPKKDMTAKQGKTSTKTLKPPSTRTSVSSMKPYCPDPNTRLPVSLPVMDRWISRCMHLSCTPLHLACWRCDANSIRVLLKHGANVNAMAEELESPEEKDGDRNSGGGGHSHNSSSTASSEVSYIELAISNTAPFTLTSSSFDLPGSTSHVEYALRIETRERRGVTPLALLALGIRSPPDFSLSIGRALGLVLPALPELSPGGQIDRSSGEARLRFMEALKLLLDAGADVNAFSCIFRKAFRPLELFLQPSVDLYYAPLMPRGGRDSAVLRCMDLERVAELVLGACWELCACGARLGPGFAASMEWTLFRMDWMFLQNESVQRRFTHLAVFLGLFPSMSLPTLPLCSCFPDHPTAPHFGMGGHPSDSNLQRSARASPAAFQIGWSTSSPHPADIPRPSCVPWNRPSDEPYQSDSSQPTSVPASQTDVTLPSTSGVVTSYYAGDGAVRRQPHYQPPVLENGSQTDPDEPECSSTVDATAAPSGVGATLTHRPGCPLRGITPYALQMAAWASEEKQRKVLERFVSDIVRLSVPQRTLSVLLRFLSFPDLKMVAQLTDRMAQAQDRQDETTWERIREAVRQAQTRTLRHSCKVAILMAAKWRFCAVQTLPIPESLKRYLCDPQC